MENFQVNMPTKIFFGKDSHKEIGEIIKMYSGNILLHYGGSFLKKSPLFKEILQSLAAHEINYTVLSGVVPNPRLDLVHQGIEICRGKGIDFVLAIGGGSVIDSAKTIAAGVHYSGDVWDFFQKGVEPTKALGVGAILTIGAAGSETGSGAVITNEKLVKKSSFVHDLLFPKFAIMNPEFCYSLPKFQIAAGGADMFAHVTERYFSNELHTDLSDRLCEATMTTILNTVPKVLENPESYDLFAEMMWAGNMAHNGIIGKGKIEDWASHEIEHELGAHYDINHGEGLAVVLPAWMKYVYKENLNRFVQYAVRVFNVNYGYENLEEIALEGIRRTENYFKSMGLATRLSQLNISSEQFVSMSEKACKGGSLGALKKLLPHDVEQILLIAQ